MSDDRPPSGLRDLAEVSSPEVVRGALRRFRRRLVLWAGLFAGAVIGLALLVAAPSAQSHYLPTEFAAAGPIPLMESVRAQSVQVLVLDVARLDDTYVLRAVVAAEDLQPNEGLFVARVFEVWSPDLEEDAGAASDAPPPPGPPVDVGGAVRIFDSGFGSHPVQEIWIEIPVGQDRITLTIAAGVPDDPHDPGRETAGPSDRSDPGRVLVGSPARPGTERILAEVTLDASQLGVPEHVWKEPR